MPFTPTRNVELDPHVVRRLTWLACTAGILAAILGLLAAGAWLFGGGLHPGGLARAMKLNTAVAFVLAGAGVAFASSPNRWKRTTAALGACVTALGLITLLEEWTGLELGIDELFTLDATPVQGRMPMVVAFALVVVGAGLLASAGPPRVRRWVPLIGFGSTVLALLPVVGYVFEAPPLYVVESRAAIAPDTAVALMLVSLGLVTGRPTLQVLGAVASATTTAALARLIIPAAALVPLALGAILLRGTSLDGAVAVSVFGVANAAIITGITWWAMAGGVRAELERRAHLDALRRGQHWLAATVASLGDAVVTMDARGRVSALNPAAEALLGVPEAEAKGRALDDVARLEDEQVRKDLAQRVLRERVVARRHHRLCDPQGDHLVTFTGGPIRDGGEVEGAVVVFHDATERVRAQESLIASGSLSALGTLAAGLAHEINNPLAAAGLSLEAARVGLRRRDGLSDEFAESLQGVAASLERIRVVVRDMKLFARGGSEPFGPVDVPSVVRSVVGIVSNEVRHRARLSVDLQPVPQVWGSASQIGQVLVNLVTNAAHAIEEGHADRNQITLSTRPAPGGKVALSVKDTGAGMTRQTLGRIFTPFFTTKPIGEGTGLGLSISRGLVEAMDGTIEVESEPGRGSTFRVLLRESAAGPAVEVPQARDTPPVKPLKVLVVDDEEAVGRALATVLGSRHEVAVATSGRAALARLELDARFDAIVCDVMMPVMTGAEFHREVCARWPQLASRFIFITGGTFTPTAQDFLDRVHRPCLTKPFAFADLEALLVVTAGQAQAPGSSHGREGQAGEGPPS
ncbi:MAG: response regulator [Myxococcales bacterium]|nr:response regulator [Myxococcales bacterium]